MKTINQISGLLIFFLTGLLNAQFNVTYDGKTFKNPEVVKADIGNTMESFSLVIDEHDMSPNGPWAKEVRRLEKLGKRANPDDAPKGLSLILEVSFKNRFKFPIVPEDSVYVSVSNLRIGMAEYDSTSKQLNEIDGEQLKSEGETLAAKKLTVEEETKKIAKLMQEGKISPDEAFKRIEKLSQPLLEAVEQSSVSNITFEEQEEQNHYSIYFMDSNLDLEANAIDGTLHIIEFNQNKLVANFRGKHFVECTDVKRSNDKSSPCHKPSKLYPGVSIYEEGDLFFSINSSFKEFNNHSK
ncbi:MAG: ANTAR domain-containing protein [Bacteroidota bacterium]